MYIPPTTNPLNYLRGIYQRSLEIPPINIELVIKVINTLDNKKASIYDFSPVVIKENIHLIVHPICLLFNQSISVGQFPHALKTARVTPLYKKGPKHDVNNYRPISQLNIFSKIFEKLMK